MMTLLGSSGGHIDQIATSDGFTDTVHFRLSPPLQVKAGDDLKEVEWNYRARTVTKNGIKVADLIEVDHMGRAV